MRNRIPVTEGGKCHLFPCKCGIFETFFHTFPLIQPVTHIADHILPGIAFQIMKIVLFHNQTFDKIIKFRFIMSLIQFRYRPEYLILIAGVHKHTDGNHRYIQLVGKGDCRNNQIRMETLND